jgi:hypothetical protein
MKRAALLILTALLCGCSVAHRTFGVYGVGTFDRVEITPIGGKTFAATWFTPHPLLPVIAVTVVLSVAMFAAIFAVWRSVKTRIAA